MTRSSPLAAALSCALLACAGEVKDPLPRPTVVVPAAGYESTETEIVVRGEGFRADPYQDANGAPRMVSSFRAWIGATELADVRWVSANELRARVPVGTAAGLYRLEVQDPRGTSGVLEDAFTVVAGGPPALDSTAAILPITASLGQPVTLRVEVTNTGRAAALAVAPAVSLAGAALALPAAPPAPVDLAPGSTHVFQLDCTAAAVGTSTVTVDVAGHDPATGERVAAPTAAGGTVVVQQPSLLAAAASVAPGRASVGQLVVVDVTYTNAAGMAPVIALTPSFSGTGGTGALALVAAPPPCDLPGGSSCVATFVFQAVGGGPADIYLDAAGLDGNSGARIAAPRATVPVLVQRPPALSGVLLAAPARASVGQAITVTLALTNLGEAAATGVGATLLAAPVAAEPQGPFPAAQDVPGGATRTFAWSFLARESGAGRFLAAAAGEDANGAGPVVLASVLSNELLVDSPAALVATAAASPLQVTAGQAVSVALDVTNLGEAAAVVTPALVCAPSGTAAWSATSSPAASAVAGGATVRFEWTVATSGSGTLAFSPSVAGTDANSGAPLAASATALPVRVQAPARLSAALTAAPLVVNEGQAITVRLDLANGGEAAAVDVNPALTLVPASGATSASGPAPVPPGRIAGGASLRFEWSYAAGRAPGEATFTGAATGRDENDAAALSAGAAGAPKVTIQRAAALAVELVSSPARVNVGQAFPVRVRVSNTGDSAALGVAPSISCAGCVAGALPAPVTLAGGAAVELEQVLTPRVLGAAAVRAGASGTDAVDGLVKTAAEVQAPLAVEEAAQLVAISSVSSAQVSAGDAFTVTLRVTNAGGAAANVVPGLSGTATGTAAFSASTADGAARIAGGASATFRWTVSPTGSGSLVLEARVDGTDENDGSAIAASDRTEPVLVQRPAQLQVALAGPAVVNADQTFTVFADVTNAGEAAAAGVSVALTEVSAASYVSGPLPPPPVRLAGGATQRFQWTYVAGPAPAAIAFDASATGSDANSGAPLSAPAAQEIVRVQRPAALETTFVAAPASVNTGQTFTVRVRVSNGGDGAATGVVPAVGCDACTAATSPAPMALAGGAAAEWDVSLVAGALGTWPLRASASGTDATDGATRQSAGVERPLAIEQRAALAAAFREPGVAPMAGFLVELEARNPVVDPAQGQATAAGVAPGALSAVAGPGLLDPAQVSCAPRSVAAASIAPGGLATFSWTCSAATVGQVKLSAALAGADGNDGAPLTAAAEVVVTVDEAARILDDPFADGTAFSFVFAYDGHVFLGPSGDGRGLVRCSPDGTACASWTLSFHRDQVAAGSVHQNPCPQYVTLGSTTPPGSPSWCDPDNVLATACNCGPNLESGRGLFTSFTIGGEEWLVAMGRSKKRFLRYLYMTRETASPLGVSYVDLTASIPVLPDPRVEDVTSFAVLNDRLYVGLQVQGPDGPRMVSLLRTPQAPGLDATAADTAATTFVGTPMNETGNAISQVDSIVGFEGRLFAASRTAVVVSRTGTPDLAAADPSTQFDECTPLGPATWAAGNFAYAEKLDVTPADKAVPGLAAWRGRLYLARNTLANVPEVWMLTPRNDLAGNFLGCAADRSDWRRISPDVSEPASFADPANTRIAALFATSAYLYVGYDNAVSGVKLYRTAAAAPAAEADFRGRLGCVAPCEPLGRAGFGDPVNVRFLDARAMRFGAVDQVWATVGTGPGPVRVFRISE
jgi:hypothetical protein